jgi:hypothetical protein
MNKIKLTGGKLFYLLTLLLIIPSFWLLLRSGTFPMQDDMQAFRLLEMGKCMSDFQIPCRWIPDAGYGYGYPQFNYYAPSVYYLGQIIHLVGFQYIDCVKILFILGFLLSTSAVYLLLHEFFGGFSAMVGAVLFNFAPYRAQEVYVRGALSEFWAISFFPLTFWASYKLIKTGNKRYAIFLSLSVFFLLITHNLLPMIFLPFLGVWCIYFILKEKSKAATFYILGSVVLGFLLSSFFLLPFIFERNFIHADTLLSGYFDYRRHFVSIRQLFLSNYWGYGSSDLGPNDDLSLNSGRVLLLGGFLAIVLTALKFKKMKKSRYLVILFAASELLVLFMMHVKSSYIWEHVTILQWLQFPWRFLSISIFLLSFMSAYAVYLLKERTKAMYMLGLLFIISAFYFHASFFHPKAWLNINDSDKFSGESWQKQLTASIGDYLPEAAAFPPNRQALDYPEILDGRSDIISLTKGSNFQNMTINVLEKTKVRMQMFNFPQIRVSANNINITFNSDDCRNETYCFGLVSFFLDKGTYDVKISVADTPIRKIGNYLSLFSFILLMMLLSYVLRAEKNVTR